MDRKSAVAAAGALVLVIAGGTSALVAAQEPIPATTTATTATTGAPQEPTVVIEYVDEAGNPVPAPGSQPTTEVRTYSVDREIIVPSDVEPTVVWVDVTAPLTQSQAQAAQGSTFQGDDDDRYEHEDGEYEDDGRRREDDRYEDDGRERHEDEDDD